MDEREYIVKNYYEGGILKTRCDVEKITKKPVVFIVFFFNFKTFELSEFIKVYA